MSDILLKTEHITMQFGGVVAVDDLNIEIPRTRSPLSSAERCRQDDRLQRHHRGYQPSNGRLLRRNGHRENYPVRNEEDLQRYLQKPFEKQVVNTRTRLRAWYGRTFRTSSLQGLTVFENVLIAKHCHIKAGSSPHLPLNREEELRMHQDTEALLERVGAWQPR
jgi:branched-chain amino acid transport system ATP-binding protein